MTDKTVRMIIAGLLALALGFALNTTRLIIVAAGADGHTHEGEVGKFYQSWKQPDIEGYGGRVASCCGNQDCRPILAFRRSPGGWQVQVEGPDGHGGRAVSGWYMVPDKIWEDAQPDPRESPDERGHVCINGGRIICAVRSGGI